MAGGGDGSGSIEKRQRAPEVSRKGKSVYSMPSTSRLILAASLSVAVASSPLAMLARTPLSSHSARTGAVSLAGEDALLTCSWLCSCLFRCLS